jgi:hypothetical protein
LVDTVLTAIVTLFVGGLLGFFLRSREFRREQRVKVYGEFVSAFLTATHLGAALFSAHVQFGDTIYTSNADKVGELWGRWGDATQSFEEATARLRLFASQRARQASEEMEDFYTANVLAVPPFRRGAQPTEWGDAARIGPTEVEHEAVRIVTRVRRSFEP